MAQLNTKALRDATNWYVQLTSGEATDSDRAQWKAWINADPEHKFAWQQVEEVTKTFIGLNSKTSIAVLNRSYTPASSTRRQVLKNLSLLLRLVLPVGLPTKKSPGITLWRTTPQQRAKSKHSG